MARVEFSALAREDILAIEAFLAERNQDTADRFIDDVVARCDRLARHPWLGRSRSELGESIRSLVFERWIVFYRVDSDLILVLRVVDGARDLTSIGLSSDTP